MRTLIILKSIHKKNTEKIAKAISEVIHAAIVSPQSVDHDLIDKYDLIGFGSGIYMWKHHKSLFDLVNSLPNMKGKKAFIFSTSGVGKTSLHFSLKKKLKEKGFVILDEFSCKALDMYGPFKLIGGLNKGRPNEEDLKKAKEFAHKLKGK